jgi:rare lipoprotein A
MMGYRTAILWAGVIFGLAACAEAQLAVHTAKSVIHDDESTRAANDAGPVKVGKPYKVAGLWYYPKRQPGYDKTGIASWYGEPFHGRKTANGERFDMNALTAAHKTLPMPSRVRVTNLSNGRSIMLRVNDRGPFAHGRIIDVSRRGAQLLGFEKAGTAKVRVTLVGGQEKGVATVPKPVTTAAERRALPALPQDTVRAETLPPPKGTPPAPVEPVAAAPARVATAGPRSEPAAAKAKPETKKVEVLPVKPSNIFVQAGAFLRYDNANRLRARLASLGPTKITTVLLENQEFFRVRLGPLSTVPDADRMLAQVIASGLKDARIIVD